MTWESWNGPSSDSGCSEYQSCRWLCQQEEYPSEMASIRTILSLKHVSRRIFRLPLWTSYPTHHHSAHPTTFASLTHARNTSVASSQSTRPSEIPKTRSVLLRSPTVEDLEEQELDVDLMPKGQIDVVLTNRAAEVLPFRMHGNTFLTRL